jgi:hypothetical protein
MKDQQMIRQRAAATCKELATQAHYQAKPALDMAAVMAVDMELVAVVGLVATDKMAAIPAAVVAT